MKVFHLIISILFSSNLISQKLLVMKDSCIIPPNELNSNKVEELLFTRTMVGSIYDGQEFMLFTNEKDFKKHYSSFGNKSKIDTAVKLIDFEKNNLIVFNLITEGCSNPEIFAKIYKEKHIQIYVKLIGTCSMGHHNLRYVLIPKLKLISDKVYVNYSYKQS
jgi:hypothetical protein